MRRTTAFSVATGTALGCTVLATALTLGVAGNTSGPASGESSGPVGAELAAQLEAEADPLRVLTAERVVAARKAASAAEFAAGVEAERSGALERATRAAERVALERAAAAKAAADAAAAAAAEAAAQAAAAQIANASPRELGQILAAERGWSGGQWSCLDSLWQRESNWNPTARNASSGAFGIPQALPGSKMATAGADWATNPATQISWGLTYIADRYGSPCGAWAHSQSHNWY